VASDDPGKPRSGGRKDPGRFFWVRGQVFQGRSCKTFIESGRGKEKSVSSVKGKHVNGRRRDGSLDKQKREARIIKRGENKLRKKGPGTGSS